MQTKLFLIPIIIILSLSFTSGIKSGCSKDGKSVYLISDDGFKIQNYEICDNGGCVIYKHKAYCPREKFDAMCNFGFSIIPKKVNGKWIGLVHKCKSGCNEKSGGCIGCCQKHLFKFGRNCYDSDTIQRCGFFSSFSENNCASINSCRGSSKPKSIDLELRNKWIGISSNLLKDKQQKSPEKVLFSIYDGTNKKNIYAEFKDDFYYIPTSSFDKKKYDVEIYVLYPKKDWILKYVSSINLHVCNNCNPDLISQSLYSKCGIFFNSIQKELQGTNIDPWLIIGLIAQESSCRYQIKNGAFQVSGYGENNPKLNKACEKYIDDDIIPEQCVDFVNEFKSQVKKGVEHFIMDYNSVSLTNPVDKFAMASFGYNRGMSPMQNAIKYYKESNYQNLYDNIVRGCKDYYNGIKLRKTDLHGNDMCTYKNGYGACYPATIIKKLQNIAKDCGGSLNPDYKKLIFKECN